MAISFSVFNKFKAVDDVSKPIKNMTNKVDRFGRRSQDAFKRADRGAGRFVKKIKSIAAIAGTLVGLGLVTQQLSTAIMLGAEFEQTIVNAAAKFGGMAAKGTKNFQQLEQAARKAGATTEFTASQAGESLNFLALAGFNVQQSIAALPGIIDLATAAQVDLGIASDIATDTLGAFNLQTKDAAQLQKNLTRVTDVLAKTTTRSNTNMEQLFEVFTDAGPVATSLGASIETVAAMAGRLADAGIKSSVAGTTLKNTFLSLSATTPQAEKQLARLGIRLKNEQGNFRDMFDILGDLNGALGDMGDVERAGVLKDIFGKIPIAGVNVLLKTGADNLRNFRTEIENAAGATQLMAKQMRNTRLAQFKTLLSALEGTKISFFAAIDRVLGNVVGKLIDVTRATDQWIQANQSLISNSLTLLIDIVKSTAFAVSEVFRIVKDAGDLIGVNIIPVIIGLVTVLKTWAAIQGILNIVLTANPIGLFVVALIAVIAAVKAVVNNWGSLVDEFKRAFKFFEKLPFGLLLGPFGMIAEAIKAIIGNWDVLIAKFKKGAEFVKGLLSRFFGKGDQVIEVKGSQGTPIGPNTETIRTVREERQRNSVDVNFNGMPQGATVNGNGGPGVNINTGFSGAF